MIRLRSALASIYVLALLAIAASAAAQAPEPNWELLTIPDEGVTASSGGAPVTRHVYILQNEAGINESPLPEIIKEDLLPLQQEPNGGPASATLEEDEESVYAVSQEIVEEIVASESANVLTPELEAIAEPLDEETAAEVGSNSIFGGSCATRQQVIHRVINLTDLEYEKEFDDLGNGFSGSFSLNGDISGTVTADLTLDIKRRNTLGKCIPYSVKFNKLRVFGNATSTGGLTLTGTINYSDDFGPWQIAKPTLYEQWITVYWIPVKIGVNLPVSAALSVTANVTGTVNYNGQHVATGSLDYTCTLSNCTGTHTFDNSPDNLDQYITGGVTGRVKPDVSVEVAVRGYVYSDSVAHAQVGVDAHLLGDLWGFDGNNCGDADGNLVTETVRALTFDLDRRIDFTGKAEILGRNVWDHTIRTGTVKHIGFYDLINSSAMQPQFQGKEEVHVDDPATYKLRMRPCWPYTDQVTYQVNWGDGSAPQDLQGAPGTELDAGHTWTAVGAKTVTATSMRDAHGRRLEQTYARTVTVKPWEPLDIIVTPSPSSVPQGGTVTWTATATGGDAESIQYAFFRRRAGTIPWIPDVTQPGWQTGSSFSWTTTAADLGVWEIVVWVKDRRTPATMNTYGFADYANAGPVEVVPPLTLSCPTWVQKTVTYGTPLSWSLSSAGGAQGTIQYSQARQIVGSNVWVPNPLVWQTDNTLSWTPTSADLGTWQVVGGNKDANTPANPGYTNFCNLGQYKVVAPISLSVTASPASSTYGNAITWTATASGGDTASLRYALFRRRAGATAWIPDVTAPAWQTSNVLSWTPTLADAGGAPWEIIVWAKDAATPATMNTYGFAAYANAGPVQVVTPPLTLSVTASPSSATAGNAITWTATAGGGNPSTIRYAFFRRRAGTTPWTPDVTAPAWQTSNVLSWTPAAADTGTWEIVVWVKDGDTPATMNTYGYAAYANAGPVQVVAPLTLSCPAWVQKTVTYGTLQSWALSSAGGTPSTVQYAMSRQIVGSNVWVPNPPVWQTGNTLSWTPTSADIGTWQVVGINKDANTPANPGYNAFCNLGEYKVVAPLTVTGTGSPASSTSGTTLNWTATTSGGDAATIRYAFFRRRAGTTPWTPDVTAPAWQASNVMSWTPTAADAGTWEIIIWVKDAATPATMNTYGYAAYYNAGPVQVYNPITVTGTGSPSAVYSGTALTWTANAGGGTAGTFRYALFRRRAGTTPWTPDVTAPAWQTSNVLSWTPTSADTGTWEIIIWVKDANTPASQNTYGYGAYYNAGPVQIVAPLSVTGTGSPSSSVYGNTITWTANANGGIPSSTRYALFRRRAGTTPWTPDVTAPAWQTSNVLSWTPTSADGGTWEIIIWVKDGATPATMNTYGYAGYYNAGPVQVVTPLSLSCSGSPSTVYSGTTITWSANAGGGVPSTRQYAFFRRRVGTSSWTPSVTSPAWQTSNNSSWTPGSADAGTWETMCWVRDSTTPANQNTYGYAASANPGSFQVVTPPTVSGTGSPSSAPYGPTLTWTANVSGGTGVSVRYAFFRRRAGDTNWTPSVNSPAWQSSNTMSWTPTSADVGTWEIIIWAKDSATPSTMNTHGFATYYNAGPVQIVTPAPLTVSGTGSPSTSPNGSTICWTANTSGGVPSTVKYALFRRRAGTSNWIPDVTAPSWQSSKTLCWTPSASDVATWEIIIWVKDINTTPSQNGYGFAAYYNAGPVQVY